MIGTSTPTTQRAMTAPNSGQLDAAHVCRRFNRAAGDFADADFVHRTAADGLFERMAPMRLDAGVILDAGCAIGACGHRLSKQFRRARVMCLDLSPEMLRKSRSARGWFSKTREIRADVLQLPIADDCVDLVFANMLLPWIDDVPVFFQQVARVLRKDGLLMFSTLGPASLETLRGAWPDESPHVMTFADMHNVGDAAVRAGLRDPVVDVDNLNVQYEDADALFRDLTASGARNSLGARRATLTGKNRFAGFRQALQLHGPFELGLELVYGHAWGGGPSQDPGEFRVPADAIGRRRR